MGRYWYFDGFRWISKDCMVFNSQSWQKTLVIHSGKRSGHAGVLWCLQNHQQNSKSWDLAITKILAGFGVHDYIYNGFFL